MPGDKDFLKKPYDYKDNTLYKGIQNYIKQGNIETALRYMQSFTHLDGVEKEHLEMMNSLLSDYEKGDHSEFLIAQLKRTADEFFAELADKGIIPTK